MRQKRGQFFILAAIILVALLAGIFLYKNQIFLQDSGSIESLKKEVQGETGVVIDYGLYKGEDKLEDFIGQMSGNLLGRSSPDMIFFYGDSNELKILNLGNETVFYILQGEENECPGIKQDVVAPIGLGDARIEITFQLTKLENEGLICIVPIAGITEGKMTFTVNEIEYEIPLEDKEKNFYFVIKKEIGEEIHVAAG